MLEKAFRDRDDSILTIKVEPYFDNIRSDARYALVHRIGPAAVAESCLQRLPRPLERCRCRHPILKQEKAEHAELQ